MTDRLHFADLTAITAPFGLLDDDTQQRLLDWPHGVDVLLDDGQWVDIDAPRFHKGTTYRARPAPLEKPTVDWSQVGPAVNHFARDANGRVRGYESMPRRSEKWGEWCFTSGRIVLSADRLFPSYRPGTVKWFDSLISRPEVEG